jgi:phasin family protein
LQIREPFYIVQCNKTEVGMSDTGSIKPKAGKPRKSFQADMPVQAGAVLENIAVAAEAAALPVEFVPTEPTPSSEAAPSPAVASDPIIAPAAASAEPAPAVKDTIDMATIAPPTNDTADKAQAVLGDFSNRFKAAVEKSAKLGEEMVDFAKGNVEAMVASARVAAKAGESFSQEAAEYGKKNFENATSVFKSFATAKSPTELFQLQSDYAKASFDSAVAQASRVSESLMKAAGEIAQPISNRYALAAEKIKASSL